VVACPSFGVGGDLWSEKWPDAGEGRGGANVLHPDGAYLFIYLLSHRTQST